MMQHQLDQKLTVDPALKEKIDAVGKQIDDMDRAKSTGKSAS
jgi:hypothetical protein